MEQLRDLITRATSAADPRQRIEAYGRIVERLRDMACGYAYSLLGDFHLAEDAAQEAFVTAFHKLRQLEQPQAFAGWLRRIVWSACGRLRRSRKRPAKTLDAAEMTSASDRPDELAARGELRREVLAAIRGLSDEHREVTTLFYINGYSQGDVAEFLGIPLGTVKSRLRASRSRLRERMLNMVRDTLHQNAPGERFDRKVIEDLLSRPRPLEIPGHPIRQVWDDFKACFPEYRVVDFEEVVSRRDTHLTRELQGRMGYGVDAARILRTDLTDQLVRRWIEAGGGGCKLLTAGRTFRKGELPEPQWAANLFHQAEVLWVAEGLSDDTPISLAREVAVRVIHQAPTAFGPPVDCGGGVIAREISGPCRGGQIEFGVVGFHSAQTIRRAGLDPRRYRGLCLCFGLERCAAIRYDLNDIRELWRPPYASEP